MSDQQAGLTDFAEGDAGDSDDASPEYQHEVDGHVDHFAWYGNTPSLSFVDHDRRVNCDGLVGESLHVTIHKERVCSNCGDGLSNPSYSVCYDCKQNPPFTQCVKNPGSNCTNADCPFPDYKRDACAHTYVVYLVTKGDVKVGISRGDRRVQRWAEQGASHAIVVAETPNRKSAGLIEDALGDRFLKQASSSWYEPRTAPITDLVEAAREVPEYIPDDPRLHACFALDDLNQDAVADRVVTVPHRADDVDHARAVTTPELEVGDSREGTVLGIRGSVILTDSYALNLKKRQGYCISLATSAELAVEQGGDT